MDAESGRDAAGALRLQAWQRCLLVVKQELSATATYPTTTRELPHHHSFSETAENDNFNALRRRVAETAIQAVQESISAEGDRMVGST